ncbi:MAG: 23S rRNA pseudouridine(2605) synthase RluB [Gammaproteobacteria bacterium]
MPDRLQKWLANAGLGSRRQMEVWITDGRITVDGETAHLGQKVEGTEAIEVDGRLVRVPDAASVKVRSIAYHKPVGEICTRSDPEGRPTIFEALPKLRGARWISVGRLDVQTAGLLLLTTDGELANALMHPSHQLEREYAVRVLGDLSDQNMRQLRKGITLEDGPARFNSVRRGGGEGANHWFHIVVSEGRNRLIRRAFAEMGLTVSRLIRVRYGAVRLHRELRPGKYRYLEQAETDALLKAADRGN